MQAESVIAEINRTKRIQKPISEEEPTKEFINPKESDLEIIQQLEQEINRKLEKVSLNDIWRKSTYAINKNNNVISLNLYEININTFPNLIFSLNKLQKLGVYGTKIEQLPDSFTQLQNLSYLYLDKNQLKELPASFGQLQNLSYLYLGKNQLKELPASFGQLQNLSILRLDNNQLKELPASFGQLQNLSDLRLDNNQLKELPASLLELGNLQKLYLYSNKISQLPKEILDLNLEILWKDGYIEKGIAVGNNPLTSPPPEIIRQGQEAIRAYFEGLEQDATD
jgi:Leucine-rich repeat (LRR) protein